MQYSVECRGRQAGGFQRHCIDPGDRGGGGAGYPRVGSLAGTGDKRPARILIVDDNVALAENIAELLEGDGYATVIAASAEEALPKALAQEFGVVVTDFRLPGMNGVGLIQALRAERLDARAIVISAYGDDGTVNAVRQVGARFLEKPLDFGALKQFIRGPGGLA